MGTPIIVLAGQSNASRIAGEVRDALDARYGAGRYILVSAYEAGAPLTTARASKGDWLTEGELRDTMVDATVAALQSDGTSAIAGVIWVQGEADTRGGSAPDTYVPAFFDLFLDFRNGVKAAMDRGDTGIYAMEVVIAGLSDVAPAATDRPYWGDIQNALTGLDSRRDWITTIDPDAVAAAAGLAPEAMFRDGLHYSDAASVALASALVGALDTPQDGAEEDARLTGSNDDDVFLVDRTGTGIDEPESAGTDHVVSSVSYSLRDVGQTIENLTLTGEADLTGIGNSLDNVIIGNTGNNALNGAWGNDWIEGGAGNDTLHDTRGDDTLVGGGGDDVYTVDSANDIVIEEAGGGHDLIRATVSVELWGFGQTVEDLHLLGSADLDGVGNGLSNTLTGNSGDNILYGARGSDTIMGLGGDDTLIGGSGRDDLDGGAGDDVLYGDLPEVTMTPETGGRVYRLYQATLDRAPDAAGFEYWADRLATGADYLAIIAGFVKSDEFQLTYGPVSDTGFVELLYLNVLDRPSDPSGYLSWVDQLSGGASREYVVAHFIESFEFQAKTAPLVVGWMRANAADDRLQAGEGSDRLYGGAMADTFVFSPEAAGDHHVADLEPWDTLDLRGFGFATHAEARAAFSDTAGGLVFSQGDVSVTYDQSTAAILTDAMLLI